MKLLIASDLHGSAYNCRLLLEAFQREKADRLVLLGDLLYHGPRNPIPQEYDTKAVTAMLNGAADRLLCVRGNCDSEVDQMVLEFPMLAEYAFLSVDGVNICAAHGHAYGPDTPPPLQPGDFLYLGDTAVDMKTALAAGMHPVGARWGFRTAQELRDSGAAFVAETPQDVLKWIGM